MVHNYPLLILSGFGIGVFGTLIGAGGGFILTPILLLLYPLDSSDTITSISLAVTCANAISGSVAYGRMKRISYRYGWMFSIASLPGAILGALSTAYVPRRIFDLVFSILLMAAAAYLYVRTPSREDAPDGHPIRLTPAKTLLGILISLVIGFFSSFLGIGGGIIHVPVLAGTLGFPIHIATATSHFVLAVSSFAGTGVHVATGAFHHGIRRAIGLGIGVLIGAQFGARLSTRVKGRWIIRALAVALAFVGARLLVLTVWAN